MDEHLSGVSLSGVSEGGHRWVHAASMLRRSIRFATTVSVLALVATAGLAILVFSGRAWPLAVLMLVGPVGLYVYPTFMEVSLLRTVRLSGGTTVTCRGQRLAPGRWWGSRLWQGAAAVALAVDPGTGTLTVLERSRRYRVDLRGFEAVVVHGFVSTGVLLVPVDVGGERSSDGPEPLAYLLHGRRQRELIDQLHCAD